MVDSYSVSKVLSSIKIVNFIRGQGQEAYFMVY